MISHYGKQQPMMAPMIPIPIPGMVKKINFILLIQLCRVVQMNLRKIIF